MARGLGDVGELVHSGLLSSRRARRSDRSLDVATQVGGSQSVRKVVVDAEEDRPH